MWRTASTCNRLGKRTLRCRERSRSEERASRFGIQRNGQPLCARGTTRTSKRRRMCSAQRLGWLSSSYSSTLATKLDGAQGKAGRLVKDEIGQSGRCVTQEWVDEGELPRERTKNRRWRRPYDVLAEATRGEVVV
ncbi:hypothetical protein GW17_00038584 [Ensete ventricosum]|nr:hypothetical protein GW17_00038584 [Ensete ventricosum]RZS16288.1 hypothetical protein BHM03_00048260 [Ensete ventricosum]